MKDGEYPDDFELMAAMEKAKARAEALRDLGHEMAGLETGRLSRFLTGDGSAAAIEKRRRERTGQMMSALDVLLQDAVYRAHYEAFGTFLTTAETRTEDMLADARQALASVGEDIETMLETANRLPDGRRVFRFADGLVIDEEGAVLSEEETAGIVWKNGAPSAEDYLAARRREEAAATILQELDALRGDLGDIRGRYEDPDNPLSIDEMDDAEASIENRIDQLLIKTQPDPEQPERDQTPAIPTAKITLRSSLIAVMSTGARFVSVGHCSLRGRLLSPPNGFRWADRLHMSNARFNCPMFSNEIDPPSVPQGHRYRRLRRDLRSDLGLLSPMEFFACLPKRQHQHGELTSRSHGRLFEASPCREPDSPGLQRRVSLHTADQCAGCLVQKAAHGGVASFGYSTRIVDLS